MQRERLRGVTTRPSSSDTDKLALAVDQPPQSRFDIQALRETEREYHRIQIALKVLRDCQRQRSTSIQLPRARGSLRHRVLSGYKNRYKSTNKGIRWIEINIIILCIEYHKCIFVSKLSLNISICVRTNFWEVECCSVIRDSGIRACKHKNLD